MRSATLLALAVAMLTFAFDLSQPLGVAAGMPYAVLPLFGLLARSAALVILGAVSGTALTGLGMLYSSPGAAFDIALINRCMSAVLIWTIALFALRHLYVSNSLLAQLKQQANTDPLTGLFNRRYFFARVRNELKRYDRYGDRFSIILIDADHFKQVNDTHGHGAGDATLQAIANASLHTVRETDLVGRFGGEEFIVLLPHTDVAAAVTVAERIRRAMHTVAMQSEGAVPVTLSLGVAEVGPRAATFDALLKAADTALYAAKEAGRDRVAAISHEATKPRIVDAA